MEKHSLYKSVPVRYIEYGGPVRQIPYIYLAMYSSVQSMYSTVHTDKNSILAVHQMYVRILVNKTQFDSFFTLGYIDVYPVQPQPCTSYNL